MIKQQVTAVSASTAAAAAAAADHSSGSREQLFTTAATDIAAALEAGMRANAALQRLPQLKLNAVPLSCALIKVTVKQQQQQQQQGGLAGSQQQQQLFTLLLTTLKVSMAYISCLDNSGVLYNVLWVLRAAVLAATCLTSSINSSSGGSSDTAEMWMLLIARALICVGQMLQGIAEDDFVEKYLIQQMFRMRCSGLGASWR
jgi:hypothetical protein